MTEKTISKFKYENNTYKLLEITCDELNLFDPWNDKKYYIVTKNRKRQLNTKKINTAKKEYISIIIADFLQAKISF